MRLGGNSLANRVVIAGGGGGQGGQNTTSGGAGGGSVGETGAGSAINPQGGGGGGTQAAGGTAGPGQGSGLAGTAGALGIGGTGGAMINTGGGGGAGYYGGGGGGASQNGAGSGGGGGSSFATNTATGVSMTQGDHSGDGQVVLTYSFTTFTVSNDAELRAALTTIDDGGTITFANDITLAADLPAVQKSITIDGAGHALDGTGAYRGFFTYSASGRINITVEDLIIRNTKATGGTGGDSASWNCGGGGAGLGGGIFVHANVDLELRDVTFDSSAAIGGAGGSDSNPSGGGGFNGSGGGGGLGGAGGSTPTSGDNTPNGGGGGIGSLATGGGITPGAPGGVSTILPGANGGAASSSPTVAAEGGGLGATGKDGGFGGGGGALAANSAGLAGNGGFGGGGGGLGGSGNGGSGGFGGGGGGGPVPGNGGFGGGNGSLGGGGGLGAGGALFVMAGGTVTILGDASIGNGLVAGGAGGVHGGGNGAPGSAFGSGIFIQGNNTLTFSPALGETQDFTDAITDQSANGGTGVGALVKNGAGLLVVAGTSTYTGATTVSAGTLRLNGTLVGTGTITVQSGATLDGAGTAAGAVVLQSGGTLTPTEGGGVGTLRLGALTWNDNGVVVIPVTPSLMPFIISGVLTKGAAGLCTLALTDNGVAPGTTYTLMTFGSQTGFTASDFTVTGLSGTVSLTATELRFTTTPIPPTYGVTMSVAKGKDRATFTITNTGSITTGFRLARLTKIANSYRGPKPAKPGKSPFKIVYTLGGVDITSAIEAGTAITNIPVSGSAQVLMKIKVRGGKTVHFQRVIRTTLSATSQASPSKSASATVKLTLKASPEN